jgi:hypothetical protein
MPTSTLHRTHQMRSPQKAHLHPPINHLAAKWKRKKCYSLGDAPVLGAFPVTRGLVSSRSAIWVKAFQSLHVEAGLPEATRGSLRRSAAPHRPGGSQQGPSCLAMALASEVRQRWLMPGLHHALLCSSLEKNRIKLLRVPLKCMCSPLMKSNNELWIKLVFSMSAARSTVHNERMLAFLKLEWAWGIIR